MNDGTLARNKLVLLKQVYTTVYYAIDTFSEGYLGEDLAYLLGAIIQDSACIWPEDRDIVVLLKEHFHAEHDVWGYIRTEPLEEEAADANAQ